MNSADLKWDESMSVKSDNIDKQHKQLFSILNRLAKPEASSNGDVYVKILNELTEYFVVHFKDEIEYMAQYNYPDIDAHSEEHKEFIKKVSLFNFKFDKQKTPTNALQVFDFIKEWLVNHVMDSDMQYSRYITERTSVNYAR